MRTEKKKSLKDKEHNGTGRTMGLKLPFSGGGRKVALLEEAITQMNEGRYGKAATTLKELLALDPHNMEARRLFATLHLRLGSLLPAKQAFDSLIEEAFARQDYWLAESLLCEYLSVGPRCVPYLEKLGMLYLKKGQIMEAVTEYARAIEILMEDPDPDDPEYASRLYRHIKDLAPASPAVIRLNQYFDPHTGALIASPLDDPMEPSIELSEEEKQAPSGDSSGSIDPGESGPENESTLRVASDGAKWSNELSPLTSTVEPLSALEVERRDGEGSLEGREDALQTESEALVDWDRIARGAVIEQTARWPHAAFSRETDERPSSSIAEGPSLTKDEPNEVLNGCSTVAHESERGLSILATDETVFVSTDGDQPADAQMASSALGLGEDGSLSVSVEEAFGNPEVGLITQKFFESTEFPYQGGEVPGNSLNSGTALERTAEKQAEEWGVADQQAENGAETPLSITGSDDFERTQEPCEADGGETILATEPVIAPVDNQMEAVDELVESANESIETEVPPACSVAVQVDPPLLETEAAMGYSPPSELSPSERRAGLLLAEAASEDQMASTTGDPSLISDDEGEEEQSIAARLDQPEGSADAIATGLEVGQVSELSWGDGQEAGHEPELSQEALVPFTPSPLNGEECDQGGEADEAGAERADAEKRGEKDQEVKDYTEPVGDCSATTLQTSKVGREEWDIELAEEQGADATIASEIAPWCKSEAQKDELAISVEPRDADHPVATEEQVFGTLGAEPLETRADDPVATLWQERSTEPERLERGTMEEAVAFEVDDEPISGDGQGQVFAAPPLEATLRISGPEDLDTGDDRSQTADPARGWSPQEAVQLSEAVQSDVQRQDQEIGAARATVAAAVEVLFNKTASPTASIGLEYEDGRREVEKATKRLRGKKPGVVDRIRGVFAEGVARSLSTATLVALASGGVFFILCVGMVLAMGVVGLTWLLMEESPSVLYQHVTAAPPRTISDPQKNGYLVLVGFNAPEGQDPLQVGLVLMGAAATDEGIKNDGQVAACGGVGGSSSPHVPAAAVLSGWVRGGDPLGAIRANHSLLRSWIGQAETVLIRYRQWQQLPFEDWGFGKTVAPPCDSIAFAHHLYLADGFLQGIDTGVDRLEADTEAWRTVLAQARTLSVKVLAIQAVRDNTAVASALLADSDVDAKLIGRVAYVFRPLNQTELSIRWPMHSELAVAAASYEARLNAELKQVHSALATIGSWFPLPAQRRLNAYAAYYDAAFKATTPNEGWRRGWPKRSDFVRFPAETMKDLLVNPIENLVGVPPLPAWDDYAGMVLDAEAHLRLVGLQAWIQRGGPQVDLFARIAKAGQGFYDPYTGLPMLVNVQKGVMYSVGHDGKDQDGDPQHDVVVTIPPVPSTPSTTAPLGATTAFFRADSQ